MLVVLRKFKMADKDDSLQEFLEFADLQNFQEGLYREGIKKLDNLQDVDECDLNEIGKIWSFHSLKYFAL